ncbi:MAG: hypothetical protein ACQEXB_23345 [Bacillota bacterium]
MKSNKEQQDKGFNNQQGQIEMDNSKAKEAAQQDGFRYDYDDSSDLK